MTQKVISPQQMFEHYSPLFFVYDIDTYEDVVSIYSDVQSTCLVQVKRVKKGRYWQHATVTAVSANKPLPLKDALRFREAMNYAVDVFVELLNCGDIRSHVEQQKSLTDKVHKLEIKYGLC
jgi:hypothetical protein